MTAPLPITACIITLNEEANIEACLDSVRWCDEILVVDSFSTDRTCERARAKGARVLQRRWNGINEQRQYTLGEVRTDWVIAVDADERVTPALRDEVRALLTRGPDRPGYLVPRHTFYLGRWIDHGGWYPDLKLRVLRKNGGRYAGTDPHDHFVTEGEPGRLVGELEHYTYRDFAHQLRTVNSFSEAAAAEWHRQGHRWSLARLLLRPPFKFLECWLWKRGFLDGLPGFVIAATTAFYMFVKYVKLWELERGIRSTDAPSPKTAPAEPGEFGEPRP